MPLQYGELTAEICWRVWDKRVSRLGYDTAATSLYSAGRP